MPKENGFTLLVRPVLFALKLRGLQKILRQSDFLAAYLEFVCDALKQPGPIPSWYKPRINTTPKSIPTKVRI